MRRSLFPRRGDGDPPLVRWPRLAGESLSWDIQSFDTVTVVMVEGELDVGTVPGLAGQLGPLADEGGHLILDMSGVRFCDCAGLSLFLRLRRQVAAAGGSLHLAAPARPVSRVITTARLSDVVPVSASVAEAIACLDRVAGSEPPPRLSRAAAAAASRSAARVARDGLGSAG
jgi:anti-sigma B factor antagonist